MLGSGKHAGLYEELSRALLGRSSRRRSSGSSKTARRPHVELVADCLQAGPQGGVSCPTEKFIGVRAPLERAMVCSSIDSGSAKTPVTVKLLTRVLITGEWPLVEGKLGQKQRIEGPKEQQ